MPQEWSIPFYLKKLWLLLSLRGKHFFLWAWLHKAYHHTTEMNRRKYYKILTKLICEGKIIILFSMLFLNFPNWFTFKTFQTHWGFKVQCACTHSLTRSLTRSVEPFASVSLLCPPWHWASLWMYTSPAPNLFVEVPVDSMQPHSWILELVSVKRRISIHVTNHPFLYPVPTLHIFSVRVLGDE